MSRRTLFTAFILVAVLSGCVANSRVDTVAQPFGWEMEKRFASVVFDREFAATDTILRKWNGPIVVWARGGIDEDDQAYLDAQLALLSATTGLDISRPADRSGPANLVLHLGNDRSLNRMITRRLGGVVPPAFGAAACRSMAQASRGGEITRVDVFIRDDLSRAERRACLVEEVAQGLGAFNDDPSATDSVFNDANLVNELTATDQLILRVLYDPRLHAGMTKPKAMQVARRVIAELTGPEPLRVASR